MRREIGLIARMGRPVRCFTGGEVCGRPAGGGMKLHLVNICNYLYQFDKKGEAYALSCVRVCEKPTRQGGPPDEASPI